MKSYFYKSHVTFEDGNTDSYTSPDISDCVCMLGKWLFDERVLSWKIVKVYIDDGVEEKVFSADMGQSK